MNETRNITQYVEVIPSITCRYPEKQNLISWSTNAFEGLALLILLISLIITSTNPLLQTVPLTPQLNVNSQVLLNQTYGGTGRDWGCANAIIQTDDGGFALVGYIEVPGHYSGGSDMWLVKTDANGIATWNQTYGGDMSDSASALIQTSDGGFALAGYTESFGAGGRDMWLVKTDANGMATWNQTYDGDVNDYAQALIQTDDGGFALAGDTSSSSPNAFCTVGEQHDMWLVKTDANGIEKWNQTYGGDDIDSASTLIQTDGGGFVLAGDTYSFGTGGMWLVKTDANGVMIWDQTYEGHLSDSAQALIQTDDGGFALTGDTTSSGAFQDDMWLMKTDANGIATWNQTYGGDMSDSASALIQTSDGGYALAGIIGIDRGVDLRIYSGDMWLVKTDANGIATWNQTYGGAIRDEAYALIQTADGGFALTGYTRSFGTGGSDIWLVKTDVNGDVIWNQTYGRIGSNVRRAYAMVQTTDGGFALAGIIAEYGSEYGSIYGSHYSEGLWLVKTDANGTTTWNQTYGGYCDSVSTLIQTSDGGFALTGGTWLFGVDECDMWLVKTNANGIATWNQTYGGFSLDKAYALIQTADGGFVLAGENWRFDAGVLDMYLVKTDNNGDVIYDQIYGGDSYDSASALIQTADGGFALAGYTNSFGTGGMWLVKTDANGDVTWNLTYGRTRLDKAYALIQTTDGGFALAGYTESFGAGGRDMWLVKTNANGDVTWNQTYGGKGNDEAYAIVQTTDGNFVLAGYTESFGAGGCDMWLIITNSNGNMIWNQTYGGTGNDKAYAMVKTTDDNFALAGYTESFGAGNCDMWLLIIDASSLDLPGATPGLGALSLTVAVLVLIIWHKRKKWNNSR